MQNIPLHWAEVNGRKDMYDLRCEGYRVILGTWDVRSVYTL